MLILTGSFINSFVRLIMYFSLFIYSFTTYLSALLYIHLHIYYNLAGVSQNKNA